YVETTNAIVRTYIHSILYFAIFKASAVGCFLDSNFDDVINSGITAPGAAQHLDEHDGACTRVIVHAKRGLHLNHDMSCSNLAAPAQGTGTTSFGPVRLGRCTTTTLG